MKQIRFFLILMAGLFCAVSAQAELVDGVRKHPKPQTSKLQFEKQFYLYNVGFKGFFCAGNDYGTHSSVGAYGLKVEAISCSDDGSTIILRDSVDVGNYQGVREIFIDNKNGNTYIDRHHQSNYFWKVEENGDYYRFSMDPSNPEYSSWYVEGSYLGWDESINEGQDTRLWVFLQPSEIHHVDWVFVTKEDYETYHKVYDIYKKAEALRSKIIIAETLGFDVSEAKALYANEASTADELSNATEKINQFILEKQLENNGNVDMTELILNPDCSDNTGWEGNLPTLSHGVAEYYSGNFNICQSIEVPNGVYTLSLQAFYRPGLSESAYEHWKSDTGKNVTLYADNGLETVSTPIKNIYEGAITESMGYINGGIGQGSESNKTLEDGTTLFIPNDMLSASAYFANPVSGPKYMNQLTVIVVDNKLKIGIKNESYISSDWTLWDNWKLTYYGKKEDAYSNMVGIAATNALDIIKDTMVTKSLAENFTNKLSELKATTEEEYIAAITTIDEETAIIKANIAAWSAYKEQMEYGKKIVKDGSLDNNTEVVLSFIGYLDVVVKKNIQNLTLTTEEVENETKVLKQKIYELWKEALGENTDVSTLFFTNTNFEQALIGWEWNHNLNQPYSVNGNFVEAFWSFDIYQETNIAPPGIYEMTLNGYTLNDYDMANSYNNYKWRVDNGFAAISYPNAYLNNGVTALKSVFEEKIPANELYDSWNIYIPSDDSLHWYPSGSNNSEHAFNADKYKNVVYGVVEEYGNPLRVGVKNMKGDTYTTVFDNIKIVYRGFQMEYLSAAFDQTINNIKSKTIGKELSSLINPIEEAGKAAKVSGDSIALFDALVSLQELNEQIINSEYEFNNLLNEIQNAFVSHDGFTGELIDETRAFATTALTGIKSGDYTTEEAIDERQKLAEKRIEFSFNFGDYKNKVRGGTEFVIPVTFKTSANNISAFQCRINLPKGLSVVMNEDDEYDIWINKERVANSHSLLSSRQEDGSILVAVYSSRSAALKGAEGEIFYIRMKAANDAEESQTVELADIRISTVEAVEKTLDNCWTWLYVKHYTPADVNKDGVITTEDRDAMIQYMNKNQSDKFSFEAADLNEDGSVNVQDLTALNDTLLGIIERPEEPLSDVWLNTDNHKAKKGSEFSVPISLHYNGNISAIEGCISINNPEWVTLDTIELSGRFISDYKVQLTKKEGDNNFVIHSPSNTSFVSGSESLILNVKMTMSENFPEGTETLCWMHLEGVSSPSGVFCGHNTSAFWISSVINGDADGDGAITTEDMSSALRALIGQPDWNFEPVAVDINNDGELSIVDIVSIIRILLGQGVAEAEIAAVAETFGFTFIPEEKTIRSRNAEEWTVAMENNGDITAFQCDIYLPKDVNIRNNENGTYDIRLSERADETHKVMVATQNDNCIRIVVYSDKNAVITGTEGDLFTMGIEASLNAETSSNIEIKNIRVCTPDVEEYRDKDIAVLLNVKHYTPADVNGDDNISIVDVVAVVNGLMGTINKDFVFDAADMNQDGQITIVDVVGVVNTLLYGIPTQTRANVTRSTVHKDLYVKDIATNGESTTFTVSLENAVSYTGVQFDMMLPEDMRIADVRINGNSGHTATFMGNRVVVYSMSNRAFAQNDAVMTITLEGNLTDNEDMAFTNIYAASSDGKERALSDAYVTDVLGILPTFIVKAQDGCIIIESPVEQSATIASVSGIAQKTQLTAGTNKFPIYGKGTYIVRIGKTTVKVNL